MHFKWNNFYFQSQSHYTDYNQPRQPVSNKSNHKEQHHIPLFHQFHPASNLLEPPVRHSGLTSDWLSLFVSGHSLTVTGALQPALQPRSPFSSCVTSSVLYLLLLSVPAVVCVGGVCLSARVCVWKSREVSEQTHADKYKLVKWKEKEITTLFVLTWS